MYASDWVFCLFASLIPIHVWPDFLDLFIQLKWPFFYSMCLSLLEYFRPKLLEEDDISGILYHIKFKNTPEKSVGPKMTPNVSDHKTNPFVLDENTG